MTRSLLEHRLESRPASTPPSGEVGVQLQLLATLSDREREVLGAIARGLSNAAIAEEMFVSGATVKSHISSVLFKTRTTSRVQAAVLAYETGFVRPGWLETN
jgi:DNA-binding NarL/FixJ family response regulator